MYVQIVHSWFLYKYLVLKLLLMFKIKQFRFSFAKIDLWYQEVDPYPGIFTWKSINLRVTIPKNWPIAGYCYPEVEFREKNLSFLNFKQL